MSVVHCLQCSGQFKQQQRFVTSMRKTESNVFNPLHKSGRFGTLCESPEISKGSFNNYVDKMREGGGQKMSAFVDMLSIFCRYQCFSHQMNNQQTWQLKKNRNSGGPFWS